MAEYAPPTSRVGHLNLKGDFSELLPATLDEQEHGGVLLRIPYLVGNFPERWFWSDRALHIGKDGKPVPPEAPPSELDYFDNRGAVGLVGCRTAPGGMRFGGATAAAGVGELRANFAVENAERASNYAKINGFRSEIDGLGYWMDLWAHRTTVTMPKDGTPMAVTTTLTLPPDVRLASRLNLCATVQGTAPFSQQSEVRYTSKAMLQTYSTKQRDWVEHLQLHRDIRDLLRVAIWKPITFRSHQATNAKEKVAIQSGESAKSRWCNVQTAVTDIGAAVWGKDERPLFVFHDLKVVGIGRWLRFARTNRRGLAPFLRLLDIREGTIDEHMTQLGIAIEALGYQAFLDSGSSQKGADRKTMEQRVRKFASQVTGCVKNIPATFAKDLADGYNAVKHANRPVPNPADLLASYHLGVTIVRAWITLQLGVSESTIAQRLS